MDNNPIVKVCSGCKRNKKLVENFLKRMTARRDNYRLMTKKSKYAWELYDRYVELRAEALDILCHLENERTER